MKPVARVVLASIASMMLLATSCNYVKPVMYIDISNHSGHTMQNLEVKHPSGIFGLPELGNEQTHRHMVVLGSPCKLTLGFEDQSGRKYSDAYDLGSKCPTEVAFDIGVGMSISERRVRP